MIQKARKFIRFIGIAAASVVLTACSVQEEEMVPEFKSPDQYSFHIPERPAESGYVLEARLAPYLSPIDFEALSAVNPDVIAWIRVPGTAIDYPIVYTNNNETYLHTDFEGNSSIYGAIFLDFASKPDFSGHHNVLYGHNMKNGSMFAAVNQFKDFEFYQNHQELVIYLPDREIHLEPIAVFPVRAEGWIRSTHFTDEEEFQTFVNRFLELSRHGDRPDEPIERIYTLVTCSYEWEDTRTLLVAREVGQEP